MKDQLLDIGHQEIESFKKLTAARSALKEISQEVIECRESVERKYSEIR